MEETERLVETHRWERPGIRSPHDRGYKKSLSRPGEFLHFLKKYVKADWMMELEECDLDLCDKEMLERDYAGKEADLLYRVHVPGGREVYIFILQELQSYVDYTMIFRVLIYVVNTLVKYFLDTDKKERERVGFRLPSMVPIVFYNGQDRWTAARSLEEYQSGGHLFGRHILNLEYYLVDLAEIEEEYILSTNRVLDNIMYCDKYRKKLELVGAVRAACDRVRKLGLQEQEEFRNWVKYILLSVCDNSEALVDEILSWAGNGEDDMAFEYTFVRVFREEREKVREEAREEGLAEGHAEGRAEGRVEAKTEDILELLEELGAVPEDLKERISGQKDWDTLRNWLKLAARVRSIEEFKGRISMSR